MRKRIVSLVLIVAMTNAMIVSCSNRETAVAPPPARTSGNEDGGIIGDPGKLHNDVVARFFEDEWKGERMTKEQLIAAVTRAGNRELAARGVAPATSEQIALGVQALDEVKQAGVFDFFSGESQDLAPLLAYMEERGILSGDDKRTMEKAIEAVEASGFEPKRAKRAEQKLQALRQEPLTEPARAGLSVLEHSHDYWRARLAEVGSVEQPDGPNIIDTPEWPQNSFSYKTLMTIAVDAMATMVAAVVFPIIAPILGAMASIAFYSATPDECTCP